MIITAAEREYNLNTLLDRYLLKLEEVTTEEERNIFLQRIEDIERELAELAPEYE